MSKNRMKKFVSVLLALTMTVLCFVPAAAAEPKDKVTPILIIAGFGEYVLVDGDEAGKKYASTVRSLLNNEREEERDHLTMLPAMDMEHFMYRQGFDNVYHRVAQLPMNIPMNMRRVITKAIHRSSKPDLAIEVAMEAGRRGVDAIPALLKKMFSRVLWLARGRAD